VAAQDRDRFGGAALRLHCGRGRKSLTPKYTATAQLYVDPRELQLVDRELTRVPRTFPASPWWSKARGA